MTLTIFEIHFSQLIFDLQLMWAQDEKPKISANVIYKKAEGKLYFTNKRIAFSEKEGRIDLTILFKDIKGIFQFQIF